MLLMLHKDMTMHKQFWKQQCGEAIITNMFLVLKRIMGGEVLS
jgi:hypothetical protein